MVTKVDNTIVQTFKFLYYAILIFLINYMRNYIIMYIRVYVLGKLKYISK